MTGRARERADRKVGRCTCGNWLHVSFKRCPACGVELGSAASVSASPPRRSGSEPPTPKSRSEGKGNGNE